MRPETFLGRNMAVAALLLCSILSYGMPARGGLAIYTQPDGTTFTARLRGDEFYRIFTDVSGRALIQDEDGWYCYAVYDGEGRKISTGYRVGQETPEAVLAESGNIPFGKLVENARLKRAETYQARAGKEPLMKRLNRMKATKAGTSDNTKKGIVILAQFKDIKFRYTRENFINMLSLEGYKAFGATGSAKDYFNDQFQGMYDFEFVVSEIVTMKNNRKYYGTDGNGGDRAHEMVWEACMAADAGGMDFSQFDGDSDGEVDNVFVFFAGGDEAQYAGEECIWSHAWYLIDGAYYPESKVTFDGVRVNSYACSSELATTQIDKNHIATGFTFTGIGTFCHEYSHTLGLPDFYDTNKEEDGLSDALWYTTSLMDGGGYNNGGNTPPSYNAIEKDMLGIEPAIDIYDGTLTLAGIASGGVTYKIANPDAPKEFFLIECRDNSGWDKYIGGSGLLVYHIDRTDNLAGYSTIYKKDFTAKERWDYNEVNANADYECADLIEAEPPGQNAVYIQPIFFPRTGKTSYTPEFRYGGLSKVSLTDITKNDGSITLTVTGTGLSAPTPKARDIRKQVFQDYAIIRWKSNIAYSEPFTFEYRGGTDKEWKKMSIASHSGSETGDYTVMLTGLSANTAYEIKLYATNEDVYVSEDFTTAAYQKGVRPYIYLKGIDGRAQSGTMPKDLKFPLVIYNAKDAEAIEWTFNDRPVKMEIGTGSETDESFRLETDGCFRSATEGILKAIIHFKSGQVDVIEKQIILN